VDAASATEPDTEHAFQAACELAGRQATLFVQLDDGRLGIRSQLSGGTQSVRSLQGMASLNAAATPTALAKVDVELPVNGLAWNLDLELLSDVGFVKGTATLWAGIRQGCLVDFVDLIGAGRLAVGLGAIVPTRLAAWLTRIEIVLAFGEGSGLAFAGAVSLVELTAEAFVLGLKVVDASL
jgi:hypothetical protein